MKSRKYNFTGHVLVGTVCLLAGCGSAITPGPETKTSGASGASVAVAESQRDMKAPPPIQVRPYVIPEGTQIKIRTNGALSTKRSQAGDTFTASLDAPLVIDGETIAKKGADVTGKVTDSDDGGRVKGVAHISVRLDSIKLDNGKTLRVQTGVYTKNARTTKKKDAVKVGVASGIGAAIGAIAGGGKGAAIGAGVGAGAGTGTVLATHGEPAVIGSESLLVFKLTAEAEAER